MIKSKLRFISIIGLITLLLVGCNKNIIKDIVIDLIQKETIKEHSQTGVDQINIGMITLSLATQIEGINDLDTNYIDGVHLYEYEYKNKWLEVELLQDLGISITEKDKAGELLLFSNLCAGGWASQYYMQMFINEGLDIKDYKDKNGKNVLWYVVSGWRIDTERIEFCLDNGLDVTPEIWVEYQNRRDYEILYDCTQLLASELVKNGYDTGMPKILESAILGDTEKVKQLINEGGLTDSSLNTWITDRKLNELYYYTLAYGDGETLGLLLDKIDIPDIEYDYGIEYEQAYPTLCTVRYDNVSTLEYMLSNKHNIDYDYLQESKITLTNLSYAVYSNSHDVTKYLLDKGTYKLNEYIVQQTQRREHSILEYASLYGDATMLELIYTYGENFADIAKEKAMYWAIDDDDIESIKYLYENVKDFDWMSGYYFMSDDLEIIKYTHENKIVDFTDPKENNLIYFSYNFYDKQEYEAIKLFIEYGNDVNAIDDDGIYPTFTAVAAGRLDILKLLIENGADVNAVANEVPLISHVAISGSRSMLKYIIEQGADINAPARENFTALHGVVTLGYIESTKILLEAGADKYLKDNSGKIALDYAKEYKYDTIIDLLED